MLICCLRAYAREVSHLFISNLFKSCLYSLKPSANNIIVDLLLMSISKRVLLFIETCTYSFKLSLLNINANLLLKSLSKRGLPFIQIIHLFIEVIFRLFIQISQKKNFNLFSKMVLWQPRDGKDHPTWELGNHFPNYCTE